MMDRITVKTPTWIVPVTMVALICGFLIVFAAQSKGESVSGRSSDSFFGSRDAQPNYGLSLDEKDAEIAKLREDITKLQNGLADQSRQSNVLNESLQEAKLLAGLTRVEGPGIEIILRDSDRRTDDPFIREQLVIHDIDVLRTVNELWASGAEAISVNNKRIAISTSFRCEGPVIYVGRTPISSPVVIRAVGDPDTLHGALTMQGRYLDEVRVNDPAMVEVRKMERMILPAYSGSTEFSYAKPTTANE
jgi:uncharacterized protein YlxW (UPF0749 family)